MFKKLLNKHSTAVAVLLFIVIFMAIYALSWIITCGIIKLITLCFGWAFSWRIATGIWLLICIAKSIFRHDVTVKK